jgi:hypothetical protein
MGVLSDLQLTLIRMVDGVLIASNDNWDEPPENKSLIESSMFFGQSLAPSHEEESALFVQLNPGAYAALVSGVDGQTGIGLLEVYHVAGSGRLVNLSTRGVVGKGEEAMIGGFFLLSEADIVVRGIGPSLEDFGVPDPVCNPTLQLIMQQADGTRVVIAENDDWENSPNADAILNTLFGVQSLAPSHPRESAVFTELTQGAYTVLVSDVGIEDCDGEAFMRIGLVEIFQVDGQ